MKNIINFFNKESSQKILTLGQLQLMLSYEKNTCIKDATFYRKIKQLESLGAIEKVYGGLYINKVHPLGVIDDEVAEYIRSDAMVSLHRVLGKYGILNNSTDTITCTVPIGIKSQNKYSIKNYESVLNKVNIHFYGIPSDKYYCFDLPREIVIDTAKNYPCVTKEKAFCDLLYLGNSKKSKLGLPPMDADLSDLNMKNVLKIAKEMKITNILDDWLRNKNIYDSDENVQANMSVRFGI